MEDERRTQDQEGKLAQGRNRKLAPALHDETGRRDQEDGEDDGEEYIEHASCKSQYASKRGSAGDSTPSAAPASAL